MTWEMEDRKTGEETKTNREGEGAGFTALASHLSLVVLRPQLLLVQSTVTGREPATGL